MRHLFGDTDKVPSGQRLLVLEMCGAADGGAGVSRGDYALLLVLVGLTLACVMGLTLSIIIEQPFKDINAIRELLEATPVP